MKQFIMTLLCLLLVACSTGDERRNQAKKIGNKIIFQKYSECTGCEDILLVENKDGSLYLIEIGGLGDIKGSYYIDLDKNNEEHSK